MSAGVFAFQNLARLAPRDVNGVRRHSDPNLAFIDGGFLLGGQRLVRVLFFVPARFDVRSCGASRQSQKENRQRRSHEEVTKALHGYSRRCPACSGEPKRKSRAGNRLPPSRCTSNKRSASIPQ